MSSNRYEDSLISGHLSEIPTRIIRATNGVPLAIEQARAMIKQGMSVRDFLEHYETQYQRTMAHKPARSAWDYEKDMSIISIFNMLITRLDGDVDAENVLAFASCFGPRPIAVNLMGQVHQPVENAVSSHSGGSETQHTREMTWINQFGHDRLAFQLATGKLEGFCLLKLRRDSERNVVSVSLHDSISRWRFETLASELRERWIIAAAYALSNCLPEETVEQESQIKFLPLIRHFYNALRRYVEPQKLEAPYGELCHQYGHLMARFAPLYLNSGYSVEGEYVFSQAIQHQKIFEVPSWPKDRRSLLLLKGLAILYSKNGKMEDAAETTTALHAASMKLFGPGDETTSWAAARLPVVRDRKIRYAENEQRAVVASRGEKLSLMTPRHRSNEYLRSMSQDNEMFLELDPAPSSEFGFSALILAALNGDIKGIRQELDRGTDLNRSGRNLEPALQVASYFGHGAVVQLLLDHGADVNSQSAAFGTALIEASFRGHLEVVEILLSNGANVNAADDCAGMHDTALMGASWSDHEAIVQLLLEIGADINARDLYQSTALQNAALNGHHTIAQLLLCSGADVNAWDDRYGTALHQASRQDDTPMVKMLLSNGADVNAKHSRFGTALQAARLSIWSQTEMIGILMAAGARDDI